jgi:hypothetical protein
MTRPSVIINGTTFALTGTEIDNGTRGFLNFDGTWTGNTLQVSLTHRPGTYAFVDEVRFSTVASAAVPEPQAFAAVFGLAVLGAVAWQRQRRKLSLVA